MCRNRVIGVMKNLPQRKTTIFTKNIFLFVPKMARRDEKAVHCIVKTTIFPL